MGAMRETEGIRVRRGPSRAEGEFKKEKGKEKGKD